VARGPPPPQRLKAESVRNITSMRIPQYMIRTMYINIRASIIVVWFFDIFSRRPEMARRVGGGGVGFDNEKKNVHFIVVADERARPGDGYFPFLNGFIIISYDNNNNVDRYKNKEMSHFYRFYPNAFVMLRRHCKPSKTDKMQLSLYIYIHIYYIMYYLYMLVF